MSAAPRAEPLARTFVAPFTCIAAFAVFGVTAGLYLLTMSRTVGFIDRGELTAVAATLGIAHPTGYPTLTLLGHLVTRFAPGSPVLALNVFAALLVAAGAGLMVPLFARVFAGADPRLASERGRDRRRSSLPGHRAAKAASVSSVAPQPEWLPALLSAAAALTISMTPIWWRQANGFEAYALHALMLPLALLMFLEWIESEAAEVVSRAKAAAVASAASAAQATAAARPAMRAFWVALSVGLALTNHLTTVLLLPALLVFAFQSLGLRGIARRIGPLAAGLALGLLPYLYLPVRASQLPHVAWGATDTVNGFAAHLTGWQYRVWMFTSWETFVAQAGWFFTVLPGQLAWAGAAVVVLGAWRLAIERPRLALFATLLFVTTVLYASNYEIHDIESYYMLAIVSLGLPLAKGLGAVATWVGTQAGIPLALALCLFSVALHYKACDESRNTLPDDYTRNLLAGMPARAVVFSTQWDYFVSPALVVQTLEGVRPDVTILDPELLRRSWYVRSLERRAPELFVRARPALERFLREVQPFEAGSSFDPNVIDAAYVGMVDSLIGAAGASRPVLVTADVDRRFAADRVRVPVQLALLLQTETGYVEQEFPTWRFRPWPGPVDERLVTIHRLYAQALIARAAYEETNGRMDRARRYGEFAATFDPHLGPGRIPRLPLGGRDGVLESLRYFERIRERLANGAPPPIAPDDAGGAGR